MQYFFVFDRHDLDELVRVYAPIVEYALRQRASGMAKMCRDEAVQFVYVGRFFARECQFDHLHVTEKVEITVAVPHISYSSTHPGREVAACRPEDYSAAAGHILAPVVTDPLDDSYRTAVTDTKPLAHLTVDVHFASRSPVKQRIAGDDVLFRGECGTLRGAHDDLSAREPLAEVVVRIAFEREGYAVSSESPAAP